MARRSNYWAEEHTCSRRVRLLLGTDRRQDQIDVCGLGHRDMSALKALQARPAIIIRQMLPR